MKKYARGIKPGENPFDGVETFESPRGMIVMKNALAWMEGCLISTCDFDADHAFLGGQFNFPVGRRWALAPSADFYLGTTGTPYRLNVDVKYHPPTAYGFFYFGGGLAILHASGNTDTGGNVFGGWEGRRYAPVKPFLEARFVFASNTSFNLLGGLNFPI